MSSLVEDINNMHSKYGVHKWVLNKIEEKDYDSLKKFLDFRLDFIKEELDETTRAISENDPEETVDGLIDIIVVALGTLDAFGVDVNRAWKEVHRANMAKEVGIKETRPNPLGLPDLIKPTGWEAPNHKGNVGQIGRTLFPEDRHRCNCYSCYMGRGYNV